MTVVDNETAGAGERLAHGEARYRAGAYAEAAEIFETLCNDKPGFPAPIRMLGLCRLRLGEPEKALVLLEQAHTLAPFDPYARLHYASGCMRSAAIARRPRCLPAAAPICRVIRRHI
jgi:tetratricopeptide (TPR) repeat protein